MNTTANKLEPQLLVSDNHGQFIPQFFCESYKEYIHNMDEIKEEYDICVKGIDQEFYWESWETIIDKVILKDDVGDLMTIGYIGESGDLWAIPEGYEYPEE
jgi:hypothetical protein